MSTPRRPFWATFSGARLTTAADVGSAPTVDLKARTITGLLVPFGKPGSTSAGAVIFRAGSITWHDDVSRIKLLVEHDQRQPVGYATELAETPEGIVGTFHVPEGDDGDVVLLKASNKTRDGLSVGVMLDAATQTRLRRSQGEPVEGQGVLRETSSVAVPAFDDSRVSAVASSGSDLVVSAWADQHHPTSTTPPREDHPMTPEQIAGLLALAGIRPSTITEAQAQALTTAAAATITRDDLAGHLAAFGVPAEQVTPQLAELVTAAAKGATGGAAPSATTPAAPPAAAPLATAGAAAQVTSEPSVYTFSGDVEAPSLCRDAFNARMRGDGTAAQRLERFNAQLVDGNAPSVLALAAVAKTTDDESLDPGGYVLRTQFRPDLVRSAINRGRPIITRLNTVPITSATPFAIPSEGEFDGVGDHVEGTAHVPEGTLTMGDGMVRPGSASGAYRISRELVDSYNPALDGIAVRAMVRDYRRYTEGKAAAIFNGLVADDTVDPTALGLRGALIDFAPDDDDVLPDWFLSGRTFLKRLLTEDVDSNGNPRLAIGGVPGGIATMRPGYTGLAVDGIEVAKASRLTATRAVMAEADAVIWAESQVQTFRFDEVEGPGILKLALWAYCGGGIYDRTGITVLDATPAAP